MLLPTLSYVICSTPRSGSNLLCELAIQTGLLGAPDENLGKGPIMRAFAEEHGLAGKSSADIMHAFVSTHQTPNGVFGFKAHWAYFDNLINQVSIDELLPGLRFIFIDRRDNLMQAISLAKAIVSKSWSTLHVESAVRATYSAEAVRSALTALLADKAQWEDFFAVSGVAPTRIFYEDLVVDPNREFSRIAKAFDIKLPVVSLTSVALGVQRDAESEDWRSRMIAETRPSFFGGPVTANGPSSSPLGRRRPLSKDPLFTGR